MSVELHYSADRIRADTTRSQLLRGDTLSVVAVLGRRRDATVEFEPLLIGAPWLSPESEQDPLQGSEWYSYAYYENFVEDIDEFSVVANVPRPVDIQVMRSISENAFKICLAEILGDEPRPDWGGEMADHYSSHLHLNGRRVSAAFLLKGPARFSPMRLNHLGKNNDQIFRLAQEPATLLIVQHCHEITEPVRATLRAFAVRPGSKRRYCLIDGHDSLRLLLAYEKLERAQELSAN